MHWRQKCNNLFLDSLPVFVFHPLSIIIISQQMEEVLKKIYHTHYRSLQRKRIQKALDDQLYLRQQRKKYDFREDVTLATPLTNLPFEDEIRFDKEFYESKRNGLVNSRALAARGEFLRLPNVVKRAEDKRMRRKFRRCVWAVVFMNYLVKDRKAALLRRKRRAEKCYKNLLVFIDKIIKGYYQKYLKEEFISYIGILQKSLRFPTMDQHKQIIQMLYYTSEKLGESTVTKDMLQFFVFSATRNGFPPSDYLSQMEISRLQFSARFGCLEQISPEQSRMLVGLGLGVKMFCYYILYQPWNLSMATELVLENKVKLREIVERIGSIYYFIILEEFCFKLKEFKYTNKTLLQRFGVRTIKQFNPFSENTNESNTSKHIILNQSRSFLNQMSLKYPQIVEKLKYNLVKWINRISAACLKQSSRKDRRRDESLYYKTIDKKQQSINRRAFKSLEITRKRKESIHEQKKIVKFPTLKYTIE